jgi:putative transposase
MAPKHEQAMFEWSEGTGVRLRFIEPGKPVQNAFCRSFNGRSATSAWTYTGSIDPACRAEISVWRRHYNHV